MSAVLRGLVYLTWTVLCLWRLKTRLGCYSACEQEGLQEADSVGAGVRCKLSK